MTRRHVPTTEPRSGAGRAVIAAATILLAACSSTPDANTADGTASTPLTVTPMAMNLPPASAGGATTANEVVARLAPGLRACYNEALATEPTAQGTLRLTMKIGADGHVQSTSTSGGGALPPSVLTCVEKHGATAVFPPPEGGGATVVIPVTFVPQS